MQMKNYSGVCCLAFMEKAHIEKWHRRDEMWTFISCHVSFGDFSFVFGFPIENTLCWPPVFACLPHKIVRDKKASPSADKRDSPSNKGLPVEDTISLCHGLSKKGRKKSPRMSCHRWGNMLWCHCTYSYVGFTPLQAIRKKKTSPRQDYANRHSWDSFQVSRKFFLNLSQNTKGLPDTQSWGL